jgi:hypothetical protein
MKRPVVRLFEGAAQPFGQVAGCRGNKQSIRIEILPPEDLV